MKKILIVDDDKDLLFGLGSLLMNKGYAIKTLEEGSLTMAVSLAYDPDLILLDVHLADVDGRSVCRELKQNNTTRHIPIIMISADANKSEVKEVCNADDFMVKPFSLRILYSKLEALTSQ